MINYIKVNHFLISNDNYWILKQEKSYTNTGDNMNFGLYIMIFFSKVIENSLATLRLIVVANGKKNFGAILQFLIALVWILVTGTVVKNIGKDPVTILVFAFGSYIGSYAGSLIEEKLAMGSNLLTVIVSLDKFETLTEKIKEQGFSITSMDGEGIYNKKKILFIFVERKKRHEVVQTIKKTDKRAMIISENANVLHGGHLI